MSGPFGMGYERWERFWQRVNAVLLVLFVAVIPAFAVFCVWWYFFRQ